RCWNARAQHRSRRRLQSAHELPCPLEITPLPTPIPGDSVPTLTEPQGPRKPLNPTDYSLFGDTQARWVSSRIDPVLLSHREVLHYNPTHVFAPLVLTFFLLVCRIFLFALAGCAAAGPCCFRGADTAFAAANRFGRARHARGAGRERAAYARCCGEFYKESPARCICRETVSVRKIHRNTGRKPPVHVQHRERGALSRNDSPRQKQYPRRGSSRGRPLRSQPGRKEICGKPREKK